MFLVFLLHYISIRQPVKFYNIWIFIVHIDVSHVKNSNLFRIVVCGGLMILISTELHTYLSNHKRVHVFFSDRLVKDVVPPCVYVPARKE